MFNNMFRNSAYTKLILQDMAKEFRKKNQGVVMTQEEIKQNAHKQGRNDFCACGSGKKYKNCCGKNNF